MLSDRQRRNIRVVACVVTTGAAFFATLQLQAPTTDAPATDAPAKVTPVVHAAPARENECSLLQHNGRLDRIPDDLKRAILKYALCDGPELAQVSRR
jgi:hypothetical protein